MYRQVFSAALTDEIGIEILPMFDKLIVKIALSWKLSAKRYPVCYPKPFRTQLNENCQGCSSRSKYLRKWITIGRIIMLRGA